MYGKKAYQAYTKGAQYGKFGDHVSQGGKVVKGVNGPIHIEGGIESDIMKAHGSEGEYILAQKQGYQSLDEVPVNDVTGYREYTHSWWHKIQKIYSSSGGFTGAMDRLVSDPLQQSLGIGEYSEEARMQKSLKGSMESSFDALQTGSDKMLGDEGWIQEQLGEQLAQFGSREEMLGTAGKRLDMKTTGVQTAMGTEYAGTRDIQKKTGFATGSGPTDIKKIETAGKAQMADIGLGRSDIRSQGDILESQKRGAITQADVDEYKFTSDTAASMQDMITSYMTATGEEAPGEFVSTYEEYLENYG
tara:strand:- start:3103 stop:4011 length:909 start_codon:yes stop_codon:yes gene_type:complete